MQWNFVFACATSSRAPPQGPIISLRHAEEAGTKRFIVWSHERVGARHAGQINVILKQHQVANLKLLVDAAGGIRQEHAVNAQLLHHANGKCHFVP